MTKRKQPTYDDLLDCEKRALAFEELLTDEQAHHQITHRTLEYYAGRLNRLTRAVQHFLVEPSVTPYSILEDALEEIGFGRREV